MKTLDIETFNTTFFDLTKTWTWQVEGFVDQNNFVYPIDSDTKVISTIFERLSSPVIRSIAKGEGYLVETANQTTYPDFTLTKVDASGQRHRIALDIKTTYHEVSDTGRSKTIGFTLGSYTSYIRNNTKNILYPYDSYADHWVLGFVYVRNQAFREYDLDTMPMRGEIECPYTVQSIFLTPKINITGLKAGSGNTANIGSIKFDNPNDFATAQGPFCQFSNMKGASDYYWSRYEHMKKEIDTDESLFNHPDFDQFK